MKVLITGGAGFGASGIIRELLRRGASVSAIDVVAANQVPLLSDADMERVDWRWKAVHDLRPSDVEGVDVILHLAAQADVQLGHTSPNFTVWQNVCGTIALLEAVRSCSNQPQKLIYAGSGNEMGRPLYLPIDEEHPLTPHNPYAFSKAAAEMAFWTYQRCYNLPVTVMANGVVVGPGMRREIFIYKWFKNIMLNRPIVLEGGDQTRDITYCTDVVDAWMRVIFAPSDVVRGQKFQVSYCEEHSVEEVLEWCFEISGKRVPVTRLPHRPGEQGQRECFTNQKIKNLLGYAPQVAPYAALQKTWAWMQTLSIGSPELAEQSF